MAKYTPGPMVGAMSGGIGNTVATRGRYGAVLRVGVIPTRRTTEDTVLVRGRLSDLSKAWGGLDAGSRVAWETFATNHPIVDRLGQSQTLQGNCAFIQCNARILMVGGSMTSTPVVKPSPSAISGLTLTATQPSTASLAWTSGALDATEHLVVWAAVVSSAGRLYYKNLLKMAYVGAGAGTTPANLATDLNARFGYLKENSIIYVHAYVVDDESGLQSGVALASCTVAAP